MIHIQIIEDLFRLEDLNIEANLGQLDKTDLQRLRSIHALVVEEKAFVREELPAVLKEILLSRIDAGNAYWILIENYPQPKSAVRSKKGLFQEHKNALGADAILQLEYDTSPGESLLAGMIRVSRENLNYCIEKLWDSRFAFGLIVSGSETPAESERDSLLKSAISKGLIPGKIYWRNPLKLASLLVGENRQLFYAREAANTESLRFFFHSADKQWAQQVEKWLDERLYPLEKLLKTSPNPI